MYDWEFDLFSRPMKDSDGDFCRRGSSGALVESSADAVRTVLSPVRETFESLLRLTPLQLLGILNAHQIGRAHV